MVISVSSNRWLVYSLHHVPVEQSISLRPVVGRQQSPGTCEHQNTPTILTTIWYHMRLVNLGASRHLRVWPPAYDIAGCVQWNSYSVVLEDTCFLVGRRTNWENCSCVCVSGGVRWCSEGLFSTYNCKCQTQSSKVRFSVLTTYSHSNIFPQNMW